MALSTQEILLKHVCPAVGDVIALVMFGSPLTAVLEVNRKKCLGDLNALPFIAMAVNCTAWIFYAFLTRDFYIYFGNVPGLLFGMYFCLVCYKFSKEQAQDMLRNIYLASCGILFLIGLAQLAANMNFQSSKTLWGSTCVAILAVYYTAPLSSLAKVIAQRDSSSLHWPLCMMNIINGMLWFAYGLALKDYFIALPNGIGAGFNVICLAFCFVFPAKNRSRLAGEANATANWGALRLQSIRQQPRITTIDSARDKDSDNLAGNLAGNPAGGLSRGGSVSGGFFDLTQFRWRTGGSFKLGSRVWSRGRDQATATDAATRMIQTQGGKDVLSCQDSALEHVDICNLDQGPAGKDVEAGLSVGCVGSGEVSEHTTGLGGSSNSSSADAVAVVPDISCAASTVGGAPADQ